MSDALKQLTPYAKYITPAVLTADEASFFVQCAAFRDRAPILHIDVCDGAFVTTTTVPYALDGTYAADFFARIDLTHFFAEIHLMVNNPHAVGCDFIRAGARRLVAQWESFQSVSEFESVVESWHSRNAEVAVSLLLSTDEQPLIHFLQKKSHKIVAVQIMSIDPIGAQGRAFDARALQRITHLRELFPHLEISVDGGMNALTIPPALTAGATRAVVGSAVSKSAHPQEAYTALCAALHGYVTVK